MGLKRQWFEVEAEDENGVRTSVHSFKVEDDLYLYRVFSQALDGMGEPTGVRTFTDHFVRTVAV